MQQLQSNLPHMVMGIVAVVATMILALDHIVTGGTAVGVIGAATGFTMGVGGSSALASGVAASNPAPSLSPGQTQTETTTRELSSVPATGTDA